MKISETTNGVLVDVFVKPNSSKFEIKLDGDDIIINCTEEPVKGKVNKEVIKELTKLFHVQVELVSGFTSKQKQFFIQGIDKNQVAQLLTQKQSQVKFKY